MKHLWMLIAVGLVLPIAGCAKKKSDDSPSDTSSNQPASPSADGEPGNEMEMANAEGGCCETPICCEMTDCVEADYIEMPESNVETPTKVAKKGGHGEAPANTEDAVSLNEETTPTGEETTPTGEETTPTGEETTPTEIPGESEARPERKKVAEVPVEAQPIDTAEGPKKGGHGEAKPAKKEGSPDVEMPNELSEGTEGKERPNGAEKTEGETPETPIGEGRPEGTEVEAGPTEGEVGNVEGGGDGGGAVRKPTDIPGVKENTPEYAAVDLILKVAQGQIEGLSDVIAEEPSGDYLKELRTAKTAADLAKAKEGIGQVQPVNSRLADRGETIVTFRNNNNKVLQFYVKRVQGEFKVRELRVREAARTATPQRRGRK